MNQRQTTGAALFITALGLLVIPGLMVNNLQTNGLISQNTKMVCNGGVCVLNNPAPCGLSSNPCSLNNQIQFLNPCSTWTQLVTLNFVGLVGSFFSNCGQSTTQSSSVTTPTQAILNGTTGVSSSFFVVGGCTTLSVSTATGQPSVYLGCTSVTPPILLANGTALVGWFGFRAFVGINLNSGSCFVGGWNGVIGNVSAGTTPTKAVMCLTQYIVPTGCTSTSCVSSVVMTGDGRTYGDSPYSVSSFSFASPTNPQTFTPVNPIKSVNFTTLQAVAQYIHLQGGSGLNTQPIQSGIPGTGFAGLNTSNILSFLLGIIGAALLLFLGLGIGGSTQAATFGGSFWSNPQGSKLAQSLGMGLLVWFPLYSEFRTWFSSGYLPAGLDGDVLNGQLGIVSVIFTVMVFLGLYFLSQSGSAASQ